MKNKWKILSYLATVFFIIQMGYIFTGRIIHEILGVIVFLLLMIHIYQKYQWYKNFKKLSLSVKLTLILLGIDLIVLIFSAISVSTVLFPFIKIGIIGPTIHKYSAIIGCVLLVVHIALSIERKTKKKKILWILTILIVAIILSGSLMGLPYLNRHYKVVNVDFEKVIQGEKVDNANHHILTVYFTRVGNSNFEDDVDAVSGASLMQDGDRLIGNAEFLAYMIQDSTNCDIAPIQTVKKYPSSYGETTEVALDELQSNEYPKLVNQIDISEYDTIILVYPLWWNTIPNGVGTFLKDNNFIGKTIIPVATQGSSGFGTSIEDIQSLCNGTVKKEGMSIYCEDIPEVREKITKWLKTVLQ